MRIGKFYIDVPDEGGGPGNGAKGPVVPKGYVPTTADQRTQWNTFLDYAGKQTGMDLNDPKTQQALLAQYKKQNPAFSITAEQIPAIQYEAYQLRKGDKFGNLGNQELGYIRQGLSPNFINGDTANVGKLYYPQVQGYGTDLEGYYKAKFNPRTPGLPAPAAAPAVAARPADAIPLPDYDNPTSRLGYAQNWTKKYGPLMQGRGDTPLRVNEIPEGTDEENLTAKEMSVKAANPLKLDPALLYASAMEEGMSGLWGSDKKLVDYSGDPKYPIDGFVNFGLDNFSDFFPELVRKGYLPADFKNNFKSQVNTNEQKQKVNSANFKTAAAALQAKAAVMRNTQDQTEAFAKKNNIILSPAARNFFTLVNYNAGEGNMQKMLKDYAAKGFLKNDMFLEKRPSDSWKGPYENVIRRMKMASALRNEKLFD